MANHSRTLYKVKDLIYIDENISKSYKDCKDGRV